MNEVLTREEIETRYDSEWILLDAPEVNPNMEILGGKVVWHSKDRDEVYQKAVELHLKSSATLYIGDMSDDTVIIL